MGNAFSEETISSGDKYFGELRRALKPADSSFIEGFPALPQLHQMNESPSIEKVETASQLIKNIKYLGADCLTSEIFKNGGRVRSIVVFARILCCILWYGRGANSWKHTRIVTIYKRKATDACVVIAGAYLYWMLLVSCSEEFCYLF